MNFWPKNSNFSQNGSYGARLKNQTFCQRSKLPAAKMLSLGILNSDPNLSFHVALYSCVLEHGNKKKVGQVEGGRGVEKGYMGDSFPHTAVFGLCVKHKVNCYPSPSDSPSISDLLILRKLEGVEQWRS